MLLPSTLKKCWIYQVLSFILSRDTSSIENKVPDWEFYWSAHHEFYTRLRIWNFRSVWSTEKLISLSQNENSSEKKNSFNEISFSRESKCSKKKKISKMEIVIQSLAIKCYYEFHLSSHKDLEMLILAATFLFLIKTIL